MIVYIEIKLKFWILTLLKREKEIIAMKKTQKKLVCRILTETDMTAKKFWHLKIAVIKIPEWSLIIHI